MIKISTIVKEFIVYRAIKMFQYFSVILTKYVKYNNFYRIHIYSILDINLLAWIKWDMIFWVVGGGMVCVDFPIVISFEIVAKRHLCLCHETIAVLPKQQLR